MIYLLRCLDGSMLAVLTHSPAEAPTSYVHSEMFTRQGDETRHFDRHFSRVKPIESNSPEVGWLYEEQLRPGMPPEIQQRRFEEVERAWLRLDSLVQQLRRP